MMGAFSGDLLEDKLKKALDKELDRIAEHIRKENP